MVLTILDVKSTDIVKELKEEIADVKVNDLHFGTRGKRKKGRENPGNDLGRQQAKYENYFQTIVNRTSSSKDNKAGSNDWYTAFMTDSKEEEEDTSKVHMDTDCTNKRPATAALDSNDSPTADNKKRCTRAERAR